MDRYLTARSPKKSSTLTSTLSAPGPLGTLGDLLGLSEPRILVPQSPKRLSPQKRSPRRLVDVSDASRNSQALEKAAQDARLTKKCVVETSHLRDDFYSSLLSPHPTMPLVAVGIRTMVQFWSCQSGGDAADIPSGFGTVLCLVHANAQLLVVGYSGGTVLIYDHTIDSIVAQMSVERGSYPTCLLANGSFIYVGTSTGSLVILKISVVHRMRLSVVFDGANVAGDIICGLKLKKNILVIGSNDGTASVWNISANQDPVKLGTVKHKAAIKAIEFFNGQPFFITGGGRADRCVRIWNLNTFELHHQIEVPAQVTGLIWVGKNELFIALGHSRGTEQSMGQIWRFENGTSKLLIKIADKENPCRAVYAVNSKDGLVVGTNTKRLYYFLWKAGTVSGCGLTKSLLSPIR